MSAPIRFHRIDALPTPPNRVEIVAGLIAAGEIIALSGEPGSGKSALAARLATSIADGLPFLGRTVTRGSACYVAGERSGEAARRLLAIRSDPTSPLFLAPVRLRLSDTSTAQSVIAAVREIERGGPPCRMVVIDTLARCIVGLDENSSRDMGLAMEALARISEALPGAAIVLVHHTAKAGGLRGSSAILGAVDAEIAVEGSGARRRLVVVKANAVEEGAVMPFRLIPRDWCDGTVIAAEPDEDASQPSAAPSRLSRDARTALALLEKAGGKIEMPAWREAAYAAFGSRSPDAKRRAFFDARKALLNAHRISVEGDTVSVSMREENVRTHDADVLWEREEKREEARVFRTRPHAPHAPHPPVQRMDEREQNLPAEAAHERWPA
jgi:hypothetical protein